MSIALLHASHKLYESGVIFDQKFRRIFVFEYDFFLLGTAIFSRYCIIILFKKMLITGYNLSCLRNNCIIFKDLSFTLKEGNIFVLYGPNGSGKSSFLKILAKALGELRGSLFFNNNNVLAKVENFNDFFYFSLPMFDTFFNHLTVKQFFNYLVSLRKLQIDITYIEQVFQIFELTDFLQKKILFLSNGQKQKLCISLALLLQTPIWLLDEPLNALDTKNINLFSIVLNFHRMNGGIIFLATHVTFNVKNTTTLQFY